MFSRNRPDRDDRRKFRSYWSGRGPRAEYWLGFAAVTGLAMLLPNHAAGAAPSGAMLIFTIRRFHDFGRSGWWTALPFVLAIPVGVAMVAQPALTSLLTAVAIVGSVGFTAFVGLMPGDKEENRFGEPPTWNKRRAKLQETFS